MSKKLNTANSLQGITRILADATVGVSDIVENMHKRVVHPPFLPSTPIQHLISNIASFTYQNIRRGSKVVGKGVEKSLEILSPYLGKIERTSGRDRIRSVLNGVVGDYLVKTNNPLHITMQLRYDGKSIDIERENIQNVYPNANGKILLMIHGSCLNDHQWTRKEHNHGKEIAHTLDKTPIYLLYNSGQHISTNGKDLNELIEKLMSQWPVPVEEIVIIAHSMGGLVTRSAIYYSQLQQKQWTKSLKKVIFLGTPHHGAPLEKIGNYIDSIFEFIPYTKPLAPLGKIRSAGVTDLRYGHVTDQDWQGKDRFKLRGDRRAQISLPDDIEFYAIAGSKSKNKSKRILGDKMVTVQSALGIHVDPTKHLHFKSENTWIAFENTHSDLLSSPEVYTKIKSWLG